MPQTQTRKSGLTAAQYLTIFEVAAVSVCKKLRRAKAANVAPNHCGNPVNEEIAEARVAAWHEYLSNFDHCGKE